MTSPSIHFHIMLVIYFSPVTVDEFFPHTYAHWTDHISSLPSKHYLKGHNLKTLKVDSVKIITLYFDGLQCI